MPGSSPFSELSPSIDDQQIQRLEDSERPEQERDLLEKRPWRSHNGKVDSPEQPKYDAIPAGHPLQRPLGRRLVWFFARVAEFPLPTPDCIRADAVALLAVRRIHREPDHYGVRPPPPDVLNHRVLCGVVAKIAATDVVRQGDPPAAPQFGVRHGLV